MRLEQERQLAELKLSTIQCDFIDKELKKCESTPGNSRLHISEDGSCFCRRVDELLKSDSNNKKNLTAMNDTPASNKEMNLSAIIDT